MDFSDKPIASTSIEQSGDGWLVITRNVAGKARDERFFRSRAEAEAYHLAQNARVRAENGA